MLDKPKRNLIHVLHQDGQSLRSISRLLKISKNTVRKVLKEGVDVIFSADKQSDNELTTLIRTLFKRCLGNVVRVQEILKSDYDQVIAYSTLTRFVREYEMRGLTQRSGHYVFEPGVEMQHDTSPHKIRLAEKKEVLQCASLVFAYSRKLFIQYYQRFTRFEAKTFLKEALLFFDGSCQQCIIDNTSVILASGSGSDAVMTPEMLEFGRIFGFKFKAHAIGHADRKAFVERNFHYVENNFLAGRDFANLQALNHEAIEWCKNVANKKEKRSLGMTPEAAFIQEKSFLAPLPTVLPPIYEHCRRQVDSQGYINLETHRYSVPEKLIDKPIDVYKYQPEIHLFYKTQEIARHLRFTEGRFKRSTLKGHHTKRWSQLETAARSKVEKELLEGDELLACYVKALKKQVRGRGMRPLTKLLAMKRTYPSDAFNKGISQALKYNLMDMNRLENLIIK